MPTLAILCRIEDKIVAYLPIFIYGIFMFVSWVSSFVFNDQNFAIQWTGITLESLFIVSTYCQARYFKGYDATICTNENIGQN